jgi:hypothetical protein
VMLMHSTSGRRTVWAHDEAMTHEVGAVVYRYRGCHSRDL